MLSKVTVAAAAAVAFLLASPVSAFPSDCTRNYTIVSGDICDSISAAHNSSTYQLAVVNRDTIDSTCSNLMPGETICLGTAGEDCTTTYVVKSGDSCGNIQTQFGLNSTLLELNNPQINEDCSNIYPGEVLCVASTVLAPPVPTGFFTPTTGAPTVVPTTTVIASTSAPTTTANPGVVATNNGGDGSADDDSDVDWIPTNPGDEGYSDDLPICGDD